MAAHELALKLEKLGLWKKCLGDEKGKVVLNYLSNQTTWNQFLSGTGVAASLNEEQRRAEFELGMQVRCLLYGEMAVALYSADCAGKMSATISCRENAALSFVRLSCTREEADFCMLVRLLVQQRHKLV